MIDLFSGTLSLFAFAAVVITGLVRGDACGEVLVEGLVGMLVFLCIGKLLGHIGRRLVAEGMERKKDAGGAGNVSGGGEPKEDGEDTR